MVKAIGPSAADAAVWTYRGRHYVTVAVKAEFSFARDSSMIPLDATPLRRNDEYQKDAQGQRYRAASELAPYLPRAEVLFVGHAHGQRAGARTEPRFAVFREEVLVNKRIQCFGAGRETGHEADAARPPEAVEPLRQPLVELADDFDFRTFQAAPEDQQCALFRGDEWVALFGLHPDSPQYRSRLPGARRAKRE